MTADTNPEWGLSPSCGQCGHSFGLHLLVMLESTQVAGIQDVPVAGVVFCPDCDCMSTWSAAGHPEPEMPSPFELAAIRREALNQEEARRGQEGHADQEAG